MACKLTAHVRQRDGGCGRCGGGALSIDDDPGEAGRGGDGGRGVVILRYARIKKGIVVSFR